jgi:membrane protein required for colicin V production
MFTEFVVVDYMIMIVLIVSALISLVRGFIKESLSLLIWFFSFVISNRFYMDLAVYLTSIQDESLRQGTAIILLFVSVLMIGALINYIMGRLVVSTGLTGTDRVLGLCFGALRGTLVIAAILFFIDIFTPASQSSWWLESKLIPEFQIVIQWFYEMMASQSSFIDVNKLLHRS